MKSEKDKKKGIEKNDEIKKMDVGQGRFLAGGSIIIVGLGLLLQNTIPGFSFNYVWPLLIIMVGLFLIVRKQK